MARYRLLDGRHVQEGINQHGEAVDRIYLPGEEFDSDDDLLALNPKGGMPPRYELVREPKPVHHVPERHLTPPPSKVIKDVFAPAAVHPKKRKG